MRRRARSGPSTCACADGTERGPALGDVIDLSGPLAEVARRAAAARAEEEAIELALRETDGDRAAAAERLGISVSTLAAARCGAAGDGESSRRAQASRLALGAQVGGQHALAQADGGRRHLHQLVVVDELERLLQVQQRGGASGGRPRRRWRRACW